VAVDLKELGLIDPRTHWYYRTKLMVLERVLERFGSSASRIVDVGSGSGYLARELVGHLPAGSAVCVDPNYPRDWDEDDGRMRFRRSVGPDDLAGADAFLFIDVLEHVPDDVALLRQYLNGATPGSLVIVTVPAFPSMWSAHDVYLEHLRRYRMAGILDTVKAAGLTVEHSRYLYASIFPAAWVVRWFRRSRRAASDLQPVPQPVNALLVSLLNAEHRLRWNRLFGLSALVVARVR